MSLRWVARAVDQVTGRVRTSSSSMPSRWSACVGANASEITRMNTAQSFACYSTSTLDGMQPQTSIGS
eukprot:3641664-Pyramimonas_sp.AAC.1